MDIDPALKGTTFAKALEEAERTAEAKRAQRALETGRRGGIPVITQSHALAQAMRGQPIDNSLITQEIHRMTQTTPDLKAKPYSEAQVKILTGGLDVDAFKLPQGTAAHRLFDEKLIEMADTKGSGYRLTPLGRKKATQLAQGFAAITPAPTQTSDPLNGAQLVTDGKVIGATPRPAASDTPVEVAALHIQLKQVTALANDRGQKVDELTKKTDELTKLLRQAEAEIERLSGLSGDGMNNAAEQIEYYAGQVDTLTARIKTLEAARTSSPDNVDALLAANRAESFENILTLAKEDGFNGAALDYVIWLRHQLEDARTPDDSPDWLSLVITPIVDIMFNDGSITLANGDILNDPETITRYVSMKVQAVRDLMEQNETYLRLIDERDHTIESLRRCVDELKVVSEAWETRYREADAYNFDALVLNELCGLLPEVQKYRVARMALEGLKKAR